MMMKCTVQQLKLVMSMNCVDRGTFQQSIVVVVVAVADVFSLALIRHGPNTALTPQELLGRVSHSLSMMSSIHVPTYPWTHIR